MHRRLRIEPDRLNSGFYPCVGVDRRSAATAAWDLCGDKFNPCNCANRLPAKGSGDGLQVAEELDRSGGNHLDMDGRRGCIGDLPLGDLV